MEPVPGHSLPGKCQHRRRSIDADQRNTGARERKGDPAGAAAQLQHGAAGIQGEIPPERHVAAAQGLRILPVVERRVVVPAFVAFHVASRGSALSGSYDLCPTVANSIVCWISTNAVAAVAAALVRGQRQEQFASELTHVLASDSLEDSSAPRRDAPSIHPATAAAAACATPETSGRRLVRCRAPRTAPAASGRSDRRSARRAPRSRRQRTAATDRTRAPPHVWN